MNIQPITRSTMLFGALALSGNSQAISVNFNGVLDPFNVAPFTTGDVFTGSFDLDEAVIPTGSGTKTFTGVVDNFMLDVAGNIFTGQNGRLQQFTGSGGGTDFFSLSIGGSNGTISGNIGANTINRFTVNWRGAALFPDPSVLAQNLTTGDFSFKRITIRFSDGSTTTSTIDNASNIAFGGTSVVPVPAALWLFGSGLLGMIGIARRKARGAS